MSVRRQTSRATNKNSSSIFLNSTIEHFLEQFSQFLHRHVEENKSETVLLAGPPSSGKTKLLEHLLSKLTQENSTTNRRLFIFRLHGLIHAVESLAIEEILSQYDLQTKTNDDKTNFPSENLQILLETIANVQKEKKIYFIFVLDHFEQFTYQKLNSILYTLFDAVYLDKKSYSILTIAVSNRADCLELPEKRLKSRFSQIYFIVSPPPVDEYLKYLLQSFKSKKELQFTDDLFSSLENLEQKLIYKLRDSNVSFQEDHQRPDQRLDGCLTHLELLLLIISQHVVQRMEEKQQSRLTGNNDQSDDDENNQDDDGENAAGLMTDTKFTFDQVYHEYAKYTLKNQKYAYEKPVVRKVGRRSN